jgi:NTP pyrophosphatase (non-canonical NTP hydrolase)
MAKKARRKLFSDEEQLKNMRELLATKELREDGKEAFEKVLKKAVKPLKKRSSK